MNSETPLMKRIFLGLSQTFQAKVFRNQTGKYKLADGRYLSSGVGGNGGSDGIGWVPLVITKEMVGRKVAVFLAVEVKTPKSKSPENPLQVNFIRAVNEDGGIGIITKSLEESIEYIRRRCG